MGRTKKNRENLTPAQKDVKRANRVIYAGESKNMDPDVAKDIIILYVTCKLGYSPIRHIIGHKTDRKIEDVIRQHMFGRLNVKGEKGEIYCKGSSMIEEYYKSVIEHMVAKYKTKDDPYVARMLATGRWSDDPIKPKIRDCPKCGKHLEDDWKFCPICRWSRSGETSKKLF